MAQYRFGTASVINGSPVIVGAGTTWLSNAAAGDLFSLLGQGVWYTILSVADDTHLTLASNFVGATAATQSYGIQRDFTPVMNYPTPAFGDQDTASLIAQTLLQLDAQMAALSPVMSALNGVINVTGAITVEGTILNASTAAILTTPRTITLSGPVTGSVSFDGSQNVSITTTITDLGAANGVATLDSNGKVPISQINASLIGALNYQGAWNAATNTPVLASSIGVKGFYYKISVAGTTTINDISQWNVGDFIAFNGTTWDKFDGISSEVFSVAGRTGPVILTSSDLADSTIAGRALLSATTVAAQKTALAIAADDVSGLVASATTDATNAANITAGTLPVERLPLATSSIAGAIITGANITNTAGTLSITGANVIAALGLTPFNVAGGTIAGDVVISGSGGADTTQLIISAPSDINGANIKLVGNGATTPNKWIRVVSGEFQIINSASLAAIFTLSDSGNATFTGTLSATSLTVSGALSAASTTISGDLSTASLTASGNATISGALSTASLTVSGNATIVGTLTITGGISAASLPNPTASTLGGVKSQVAVSNSFLTGISTAGVPIYAQPSFANLSGSIVPSQIPTATGASLGGVIIGSNITNTSGTISLTSGNVTTALGYTPLSNAGGTLSGSISVNGSINASSGYVCRAGSLGATGNIFNFYWTGTNMNVYVDTTFLGAISFISDPRFKKNIVKGSSTLDVIKKIEPIEYNWRDIGIFKDDGKLYYGFNARQVWEIFPQGVHGEPDDLNKDGDIQPQSLNIIALVAALTSTVKELITRIEVLEARQ